jgi:hypothetical protein
MPILADDDVIVDGDAERDGNVDDGLGRLEAASGRRRDGCASTYLKEESHLEASF